MRDVSLVQQVMRGERLSSRVRQIPIPRGIQDIPRGATAYERVRGMKPR